MSLDDAEKENKKSMKYYYLHREEILERRRAKKMEDPAYRAALEEKEKAKTEKAAEAERKRAEREAKRKERIESILNKEAELATLKQTRVAEMRALLG